MNTLTIPTDLLISLIKGIDKDELILKLVTHYPDIFVNLMHYDNLQLRVQQAYYLPGSVEYTAYENVPRVNKVRAIKEYRTLTGASLKDAKLAVEQMIERKHIVGPS